MGEREKALTKPVRWISNQIAGVGYPRLNKIFGQMAGDVDPRGPHKVAEEMLLRNQTPQVVQMPGWGLLHFAEHGDFGPKSFSSQGMLNPQPITQNHGNMVWEYRDENYSILPAGINTKTGNLCFGGSCAPRAVVGSSGGRFTFDDVVSDMQWAFWDPTLPKNQQFITFKPGDGPSAFQLDDYLLSGPHDTPHNDLDIEMSSLDLPRNVVNGTNRSAIRNVYRDIERNHPQAIVVLENKRGAGHAISYNNGLQQRYDRMDLYNEHNTNKISEVYVPNGQ